MLSAGRLCQACCTGNQLSSLVCGWSGWLCCVEADSVCRPACLISSIAAGVGRLHDARQHCPQGHLPWSHPGTRSRSGSAGDVARAQVQLCLL